MNGTRSCCRKIWREWNCFLTAIWGEKHFIEKEKERIVEWEVPDLIGASFFEVLMNMEVFRGFDTTGENMVGTDVEILYFF